MVNIDMRKPAAASERTALAETQTAMENMKRMKGMFKDEYVGPIVGRKGQLTEELIGVDPDRAGFYASEQAIKNQMIKSITGAQMSEPEAKRIMSQLPTRELPPSTWKARWDQTMKNFAMLQKKRRDILISQGITPPDIDIDVEYFDNEDSASPAQKPTMTWTPGSGLGRVR
jgi:hypothetical protein